MPGNNSRRRSGQNAQLAFLHAAAANGIVEVHECAADGVTGRADLAALLTLDGPIPVRGYLAVPVTDPEQARQLLADTGAHALGGDLTVDGAIGSRTAALHHPYDDAPGNSGVRYLSEQQIADHLVACTLAGVQAGFHAIGDDAVSAVGRALREATSRLGANATVRMAGCAHRIEHAEMADDQAIAALAETGMVASMQPLFDAAWGGPDGMYARRLGSGPRGRDEPVRHHGGGRRRAGLRVRRAGDGRGSVAGRAGGRAPPHPGQRTEPAVRVHRAHQGRAPGGGPDGPRDRHHRHRRPGPPGDRCRGRELVRPAADPKVARWSTDPRSRVPLLPDLTPGVDLPHTLATIVGGRVVFDTGLFE